MFAGDRNRWRGCWRWYWRFSDCFPGRFFVD